MAVLVFVAYLCAIFFVGFRATARRKEGAEDYILASRSLTLPNFIATLVPSFYGGVLGVGEYTYRYGISNWITQGLPYYIFSLLYAVFLAHRIRIAPGQTLPDHMERVYGRPMAILAAMLVFLLASPADDVLMLGILTRWITGWPQWACVALVTAVGLGLLFFGGLRSDVRVNRVQILVMFAGFGLILPFAFALVGSGSFLRAHVPASHFDWTGEQKPLYLISWFFIALWTFVDPTFHQRVCATKDAKTARLGIICSVLFWLAFDAMTTTTGLYARALLPNLKTPLLAYPTMAGLLLPSALQGLFLAGLSSSTLAALQSKGFISAISLAKDAAARLCYIKEEHHESWIRWGLCATGLIAILLALALPSVVELWYVLGSTVLPGLLIPLISSYFQPLRMPRAAAFLCSLGGWLGSTIAWALGSSFPFYPGLAISAAIWLAAFLCVRG